MRKFIRVGKGYIHSPKSLKETSTPVCGTKAKGAWEWVSLTPQQAKQFRDSASFCLKCPDRYEVEFGGAGMRWKRADSLQWSTWREGVPDAW